MQTDARQNRRALRLRNYDYSSPGFYFVTICTHNRHCLLGETVDGNARLKPPGVVVGTAWKSLPVRFPSLATDVFVIMPNHVHGIIQLGLPESCRAEQAAPLRCAPSVASAIRAFKSTSAKSINRLLGRSGLAVWQCGYFERVIRDENELTRAREYIVQNPLRWALDHENPAFAGQHENGRSGVAGALLAAPGWIKDDYSGFTTRRNLN